MRVINQSQKNLNEAINVLKEGGVVICPTDTVYGFVADATNKKAVEKIYKIKKRPKSKPLAVFVKDIKMAEGLAEIDEKQTKLLNKYWPGKYTFVLKRLQSLRRFDLRKLTEVKPLELYGIDEKTIALRIPKYKFLNDLLKKMNKPLVQTSVNISGEPSPKKISDIINQFGKIDISIVNAGDIGYNKSSKILDLTNNKIKILRK